MRKVSKDCTILDVVKAKNLKNGKPPVPKREMVHFGNEYEVIVPLA